MVYVVELYNTFLEQFYKNRRIIFAQNLRTIPASADKQSLKFLIKVMNKTTVSAAQFAKYMLLHTYSRTNAARSCASTNKTLHRLFNKLA